MLTSHVTRLERLQQASDILRRTSRFVVLLRRLQVQLAEMDRAADSTPSAPDLTSPSGSKSPKLTHGRERTDSLSTVTGVGGNDNEEDEKERTIAKAALSIAELSQLILARSRCCPTNFLASRQCL